MISRRFRQDYTGEFVVTSTSFRDGEKIQSREWLDNPIVNQHISGRAAVIISDSDRERFDYARLRFHNGGLRGSKKLQTYGTGVTWQHLQLQFYVTTDALNLTMISHAAYNEATVVYTDRKRVLEFPGKFFLVPFCPLVSDPALALYLAAFDGHREIFVLGHAVPDGLYKSDWIDHIREIMQVYSECEFYFVSVSDQALPASWRSCKNFKHITPRKFVSFCDI